MLLLSGATKALRVAFLETAIAKRDSLPPTNPTFINTALNAVNTIHGQHDAAKLTWDADLAAIALTKANGCTLNHTGAYGENAYYFWFKPATRKPNFTAQTQVGFDAWVGQDEVDAYLAGDPMGGGHFTQTVWKSSRTLGCAFSTKYCAQNPKKE
ncbi:CAP domain-containing protein [Lasiosphaeria miniovina]|uniref:CAP domain-containing protein n=1 Tax=Lasiosphaeria miniovina TaxID=1954250 RepID=A0AA40AT92_9PEZI|nr:CAP domain-containing protein [Lasiosphaeria miniovina]KAK0721568.1 CAP domain-containing protein [Lasiosphaeria miniovina]